LKETKGREESKESKIGVVNAAICVLDDIIEHCGAPARAYCPQFIPILLHFATSQVEKEKKRKREKEGE